MWQFPADNPRDKSSPECSQLFNNPCTRPEEVAAGLLKSRVRVLIDKSRESVDAGEMKASASPARLKKLRAVRRWGGGKGRGSGGGGAPPGVGERSFVKVPAKLHFCLLRSNTKSRMQQRKLSLKSFVDRAADALGPRAVSRHSLFIHDNIPEALLERPVLESFH